MSQEAAQPRGPSLMPPASKFDIFSLAVIGELEGGMTVNTFHYQGGKNIGTSTQPDSISLFRAFTNVGGMFDLIRACCTPEWAATRMYIWIPTAPEIAGYNHTFNPVQTGQGPDGALAAQSACVIQRVTAWRGKHGRGRFSLPAVPRLWVDGTSLTTQTAYDALAVAVPAPIVNGADTFVPGILAGKYNLEGVYGFSVLTMASTNIVLGTVRRRKPGKGA